MRVNILDQAPIAEGATGGQALRNTIDLARRADALGYGRYWVAEHHGSPSLACASPEVMIPLIASQTTRIRVGSGGVMLPHYSPLKVAETFSMICGLFPGRIDLGLGRAPGTDRETARALQRDRRAPMFDDFPQQLDELLGYFDLRPQRDPFRRLRALPGGREAPEPWLLGSSPQSAVWAAELGLPYCFADFINPAGAAIAADYRERFTPSEAWPQPRVGVGVWAVCAPTDEEAQRLASSLRMLMILLHRGQLIAVPSVETAAAFLESEGWPDDRRDLNRRLIAGAPATVRAGVEAVAAEYGADEVFLVNILHDHAARVRSYELVAEAFGLAGSREQEKTHEPGPVGSRA